MAGSGVNEENIRRIAEETGIREFHFSAREPQGYDDPEFGQRLVTTAERVRRTIKRIRTLSVSPLKGEK